MGFIWNLLNRQPKQPLTEVDDDLVGVDSGLFCPKCKEKLWKNSQVHWCDNEFCNYEISNKDITVKPKGGGNK